MINLFWFRRDLRLDDNAGLYHALKSNYPVLCVFIFDDSILSKLDPTDSRVSFIHQELNKIKLALEKKGSTLLVLKNTPKEAFSLIVKDYKIHTVFTNHDYEPKARKRDQDIKNFLKTQNIEFKTFKDQVIFETKEILNNQSLPYTVYTPYANKWLEKVNDFYLKPYPNKKYFKNFHKTSPVNFPTLSEIGFKESSIKIHKIILDENLLSNYHQQRDFPALDGTSKLGLHLRFGTVSVRALAKFAQTYSLTWLKELIWREFFMQLMYHFPKTVYQDFKPTLEPVKWENNPKLFKAWCEGKTGYPLIDAGMRELVQTGHMHNRVRMLVASFLIKNLNIHWQYGERFFAKHLLDYELSSNIGNWQWCAGCGADAAPYFRIFNPQTQQEKFDPDFIYIKKWVPEYLSSDYKPIVDLKESREKFLNFFKPQI